MKAFAVANEMGRGGDSCLVAWYALATWNPDESGGAFPIVKSLANRLRVMCATLNSFK